jgi:hypothetical protein
MHGDRDRAAQAPEQRREPALADVTAGEQRQQQHERRREEEQAGIEPADVQADEPQRRQPTTRRA